MGRKKLPTKKQITLEEVAAKYGVTDGATFHWKKQMVAAGLPWTWEGIEKFKDIKRQQPAGDMAEMKRQKLQKEVERLDLKIQKERGDLVLISEMRETAVRIVSVWCSELDALVGDLPGQLAGLSEAEIQPKLRSRIELLKANAKEGFATL
jgi:hypothetical protein